MASGLDEFLVDLFHKNFLLLKIVRESEKNSSVNGASGLSITSCGLKLESKILRPVGHGEIVQCMNRLQEHGILITEPATGGKKIVRLSPECKIIFDKIEELAKRGV